jgi:predicted metal-dependent hydrolase
MSKTPLRRASVKKSPAKPEVVFEGAVKVRGRSVPLKVTRHPRSRLMRLRMSATKLQLSMPARLHLSHAQAFLLQQEDWIIQHLPPEAPALPVPFETTTLLHAGAMVPLSWGVGDRPQMQAKDGGWCITLPARREAQWPTFVRKLLAQHWEHTIRQSLGADLGPCAAALGLGPSGVTIRLVNSLWGRLSPSNEVLLDLSLALAPPAVLRYVWIHELCHLRERNHSKAFWNWVARFCPEWKRHRDWLKGPQGNAIKRLANTWLAG